MHLELSTEIPGASRCLSRQEMFQSCMNNKIENSQVDFSTLSTKTPEIQFCHIFLYCKLRTLRNSEQKSPHHPHLLLTIQHKNAYVSFIYLRSFLQEIAWVQSSKLPPLLRGGDDKRDAFGFHIVNFLFMSKKYSISTTLRCLCISAHSLCLLLFKL